MSALPTTKPVGCATICGVSGGAWVVYMCDLWALGPPSARAARVRRFPAPATVRARGPVAVLRC